jgi:hypothetical protein
MNEEQLRGAVYRLHLGQQIGFAAFSFGKVGKQFLVSKHKAPFPCNLFPDMRIKDPHKTGQKLPDGFFEQLVGGRHSL